MRLRTMQAPKETPPVFDDDERRWLLAELSAHFDRGFDLDWLTAPIVEPDERFFPDAYEHGPEGVRTIARRLLVHAEHEYLQVEVRGEAFDDEPMPTTECFVGFEGDLVVLTLDSLGPANEVPFVLAHEVAWLVAQLDGWGNETSDELVEAEWIEPTEMDIALTAFDLGFGLLAACGSHRYRANGGLEGPLAVTRWEHRRIGYLAPEEACYLLAVQAVVREIPPAVLERWRKHLGANQRALFSRFMKELAGERDALIDALELPTHWPAPREPACAPLPPERDRWRTNRSAPRYDDAWDDEPLRSLTQREPVFRHRPERGLALGMIGGFVSMFLLFAVLVIDKTWGAWACFALPIGPVGGFYLGRSLLRHSPECSGCGARLEPHISRCASCGREVAGDVGRKESHLDALERWYDAGGGEPLPIVRR